MHLPQKRTQLITTSTVNAVRPLPAPTAPPCPGLQTSVQILPWDPWFSCGASLMGLKLVLSSCLQPFPCSISCCLWRNLSLVHPLVCGLCCHPLALLICCEAVPWLTEALSILQSLLAHPPLEKSPVIAFPWQTLQVYGNCNKINFSEPLGNLPKCNLFLKSLLPLVSMNLEDTCNRK